jgi:hypothetical protein
VLTGTLAILGVLLAVPFGRNDRCGVRTRCKLPALVLPSVMGDTEPQAVRVLDSTSCQLATWGTLAQRSRVGRPWT